LLIVASFRPSYLLLTEHSFLKVKLELQARGACREIPLDFLTRQDIEEYLALAFPRHRFPTEFTTLIHSRTGGNPLFVVDLLRYLRDRDVLIEDASGWLIGRPVSEISVELPESVRSMIQRKIDWLTEEDRRLLSGASVQGYEFDSAVVASALGMDAASVEERLELLDHVHGFVRQLRETVLPDGTYSLRYQFVHLLYQNAFYESLRPTRRALLSAAVAQALLAVYREKSEGVASELAFLFEAAREPGQAVDFFLVAAQHAARVSANLEAVALARRGLELLVKLPDTPERARRELPLRLALAVPLSTLKGFTDAEVEALYNRALDLCRSLDDKVQMIQILNGVGGFSFFRPRISDTFEIIDRMLHLAEASPPDPIVLTWTHFVKGLTLGEAGDVLAARAHVESCLGTYEAGHHMAHILMFGLDPGITGRGQAARLSWISGYPDRAKSLADDGLRLARKLNHPYSLAMALFLAAMVRQYRGEASDCRELAEEIQTLCAQHGFVIVLAWGRALAGWALGALGEVGQGITKIRESLQCLRSIGAEVLCPELGGLLSMMLIRQGELEQGLGTLDEAMALAERSGDQLYDPELCRLKGEALIRMAASHEAEAETLIRRAIELARERQARSFELRAATSLARLYMKQGKVETARIALGGIYNWFTEGFDTVDLVEAGELLRSLEPCSLMSLAHLNPQESPLGVVPGIPG
jgi:predicted ATPase